jgi:hypothetical protein
MLKPSGKKIIEYSKEFEYVTDIIGKAVAVFPFVAPTTPPGGGGGGGGGSMVGVATGAGLEPLKRVIALGESCGYDISKYNSQTCYNATNPATTFPAKFGVDVETLTIAQVKNKTDKATGKYQFMPNSTMQSVARSVGLNPNVDKLTKANQEKMGEKLIDQRAGDYINGRNPGNQNNLEAAVRELAQCWEALPGVNRRKDGTTSTNNVVTGFGYQRYYAGNTSIPISEVVKALVKTRINITGNNSFFIPPYAAIP